MIQLTILTDKWVMEKVVLTPQVEAAIKKVEDRSEILISWILFFFIVMMATLYFFAPKGFVKADFEPVPLILGLFLPYALFRIVWSHAKKMDHGWLVFSIFMDIALVTGLIYSFHIQYSQPSPFYLKSPTFTYFFIFIVLRSLRFNSRYVLIAGLMSIASWSFLVINALQTKLVTRSFVDYMTGNFVLIGAEVDKIIALSAVTTILVIGVNRSRKLLSRSELQNYANEEMSRFFSPEVIDKIVYSDQRIEPGHGEIHNAVTMFMDLRGFTKMSATMPPDDVMELLADYQKRMVPVILKNNGSIDKFLGDGILAHFGAASANKTYAKDALRAVEEIQVAIDDWNSDRASQGLDSLRVGVACSVGDIIFGAIGDETRMEFTVIGDSVNLAAKLEKYTKIMNACVVATEELYELAKTQGFKPKRKFKVVRGQDVEGVSSKIDLAFVPRKSA